MTVTSSTPGTWREPGGTRVAFPDAMDAWVHAARDVLVATARRYHAYVTYGQLAEQVQVRTGIHTRTQLPNWIGKVLGRVADDALDRGEPPLTALCVRQNETVGDGYIYVLKIAGEPVPEDLDQHAAVARLECYRFFGAVDLPADGGRPVLPPRVAAARDRRTRKPSLPAPVCPHCHVQLPASGRCDNCT